MLGFFDKKISALYGLNLPWWRQLAYSLLAVLIALLASFILRPLFPNGTLLPFISAVAIAAYISGVRGALIASIVSLLCVEYFFLEPVGTLFVRPVDYPRNIAFVLVSVLLGWLFNRLHQAWWRQKNLREELESILSAAVDGIVVMDRDLKIVYANQQAQRLLGLQQPFVEKASVLEHLGQELQFCDELEAALTTEQLPFRNAVTSGKLGEAIFGCGPKEGTISRWINVRAAPVLDDQGQVKSVIAVFTDQSAQRRSLKKAEEERKRLGSIIEVMSDAVIVSDEDGVLTLVNAAAEKLIGRSAEEVRRHMMSEVYTLEPRAAAQIALTAPAESDPVSTRLPNGTVVRLPDSAERIPVSGSVVPLPDNSGKLVILRDLREESLLERQRMQAEQRLREMIDNIVCQVALLDLDGNVLEYNGADVSINGSAPRRVSELPFPSAQIGDTESTGSIAVSQAFARALQGEVVRFDYEARLADGETRSFDIQVAPLSDEQSHVSNVVFSAVEITDRKQAQRMTTRLAALVNAQRQRIEDIVEGVPAIIWEGTGRPGTSHRISFVNHYTEQLLGLSLDEWASRTRPWYSIMHPDDAEEAIRAMQQRFDMAVSEPGPPIAFRVFTADGASLYLEMRLVVIRDENGDATGMRGVAVDVTPQKEAERRIGQLMNLVEISRKRLQDTIDAVPAVVWEAVGPPGDQHMVFVSNYAEQLSGYTAQEWVETEQLSRLMILPEDMDSVEDTINRNYYEGLGLPVQYRIRRKEGGVRWVEARVSIVKDQNEQPIGVRGVTMDVTELRKTEAELRRSNEELQQFAYVASHDLQEPLRMITSYLQLIEQRYADHLDEQAKEFIGYAVGGAVRMKQLITDLLTYSRVQTNREEFRPVDLNVLVSNVIQNLQSLIADAQAEILVDPLPTVSGNTTLLTQLFQNLVNNALKFRSNQPPLIEVRAERNGPMWQFAIRDNGIGFDPRYANRVFVLFQRLHSQAKYSGTGIGLTICKKVVEVHSGEIRVESEPGVGSTFFFTLPASQEGEAIHA